MDAKMQAWCKRNRYHPAVLAWLEKHPPPPEWQGTRLEWAYTEMPFAPD